MTALFHPRQPAKSAYRFSYTQVRFLLHSYRALSRWWLSFLVHRLSSAPHWRYAVRVALWLTSSSGSPSKSAPAAGWHSSRHGGIPQRVPRLVTFASARQYNHVLSRRPASASSRRYDRRSQCPNDAQRHMRDERCTTCRQSAPLKSLRGKIILNADGTALPAARLPRRPGGAVTMIVAGAGWVIVLATGLDRPQ